MDLQEYLTELEKLVNVDSGTEEIYGIKQVGGYFVQKFKDIGWQVDAQQLNPSIAPCFKITNTWEGEYDVLLLGHIDTSFPTGTTEERPFYIEENLAYGPGIIDMKASILSCYFMLKEMQEAGELDGVKICLALNSEKETGSQYSRVWVESLARKSENVLVIEHAKKNGGLIRSRKGSSSYEIVFTGVPAHIAANPENGRSAVLEMAYWVTELHSLNDYASGLTLNIGLVEGGVQREIVPDKAKIYIDVRFNELRQAHQVTAKIEALKMHAKTTKIEVEIIGGMNKPPTLASARTMELAKLVERAGRTSNVPIVWEKSANSSDGNFSSALGIATLDGFGPIGGNSRTEKEYLDINSVEERQKLLRTVINLIKKQNEPMVYGAR